jgi:hypothetical protein
MATMNDHPLKKDTTSSITGTMDTSTSTSSSTVTSSFHSPLALQELQTISSHIEQWCRTATTVSKTDTSVENPNEEISISTQTTPTTTTTITAPQLIEQELIPFLKKHFPHRNESHECDRNDDGMHGANRTAMIHHICSVLLLDWRPPPPPPPPQEYTDELLQQQQQQQQQHRRLLHIQLLLRLVLFQWIGPLFVQVYNRIQHSSNSENEGKKNKKQKSKSKRSKKSGNRQHPIYAPFIHDMIQLLQLIALRLLPHEQFVHFLRTECVVDVGVGAARTRPSKHNRISSQNEAYHGLLQPIWDYFEIQNPFDRERADEEMMITESSNTTSPPPENTSMTIKKKRRRNINHTNITPSDTSTSTTSNTTLMENQRITTGPSHRPLTLRKNPLLQDKATFIGHHFNVTNHYKSTMAATNNTDTTLSHLFRQVPVPTRGTSNKDQQQSLCRQMKPHHTTNTVTPSTTTAVRIPPLSTTTTKSGSVHTAGSTQPLTEKENTAPSGRTTSDVPKQPLPLMKSAIPIMSVMSTTTSTTNRNKNSTGMHHSSPSSITTSTTTRHLVSEAMEAIQRRKERRRPMPPPSTTF